MPARHEPLPNGWRLWPLSLGNVSEPVSNFEQDRACNSLGLGRFSRFLSVFRPLYTVLFYTWLEAYTAAMPRKLVWTEKQNFQGFGCSGATGCLNLLALLLTNRWMI